MVKNVSLQTVLYYCQQQLPSQPIVPICSSKGHHSQNLGSTVGSFLGWLRGLNRRQMKILGAGINYLLVL